MATRTELIEKALSTGRITRSEADALNADSSLTPSQLRAGVNQPKLRDTTGAGERFLVGAGQSATGLVRGAQQIGAQITGNDERLAELQAQEAEERRLIEGQGGLGAAGLAGNIAGEAATFAVPGGAVFKGVRGAAKGLGAIKSTALAGGATGAIEGGLAGGLQATEEGESRGTRAFVSATVGGLLGAGGGAIGGRATRNAPIKEAQQKALATSKEEGVSAATGELKGGLLNETQQLLDKVPFGGGGGQRKKTILTFSDSAKAALAREGIPEGTIEDVARRVQSGASTKFDANRDVNKELFESLKRDVTATNTSADGVTVERAIDLSGFDKKIDDLLKIENSKTSAAKNNQIIGFLDSLKSEGGNTGTISNALDIRNNGIGAKEKQFLESGLFSRVGSKEARDVRRALDDEIRNALNDIDPQFGKRFDDAISDNAKNIQNLFKNKDFKLPAKLAAKKTDDPSQILLAASKSKNAGDLQILHDGLTTDGRAHFRGLIIQNAIEQAQKSDNNVQAVFSPKRFGREIGNSQKAIDVFFKGDNKRRLEGLGQLGRHLIASSDFAQNPNTGGRTILASLLGAGGVSGAASGAGVIAGAATGAQFLAGAAASTRVFNFLLNNTVAKKLLIGAQKAKPGSKQMNRTATKLEELLQKEFGPEGIGPRTGTGVRNTIAAEAGEASSSN